MSKIYNLSFLNNNNISLNNCSNYHRFDNILIHEFIKNQNKYLEDIECNK